MKKILFTLLVVLVLSFIVFYNKMTVPMKFVVSTLPTHTGAATLKSADGQVPEDLYSDTGIVTTKEYGTFTKKMTVCGITFIAREDISDAFLKALSTTTKDIFKVDADTNRQLQEDIIRKMYEYKTLIPVVKNEKDISYADKSVQKFYTENSVCDIIMANTGNPHRETIEHLLHSITNVGLHYSLNEKWGLSEKSSVYKAMYDAINKKQYLVEDYKTFKKNTEIYNRVLIQEYAYWLITSEWGFQTSFNEKTEWTLNTKNLVASKHQSGHQLFSSVEKVLYMPSQSTIELLQSFSNKK